MARTYRRDSRGRFSGGAGNANSGGGTNRASSVTVKGSDGKSVKGELGVKGKRLRNNFKPNMLTENGSIDTKRRVGGSARSRSTGRSRPVVNSVPKGAIGKTRRYRASGGRAGSGRTLAG